MTVPEPAARGFGATADLYEARRPSYPAKAVEWLASRLRIDRSSLVVDLGAGTGKLTRLLRTRSGTVIAVEPLAAMASEFARALDPPLVRAVAEALPFPSASVDAVVAAQAFHWFHFDVALAEIHRVLRPGAGLGLIWNLRDEHHDWVARLGDVRRRYGDIRYAAGEWRDAIERSAQFGALHARQFGYQQVLEPDGVVELMASRSFIAALPPAEHAAVRAELRELLATHPDTAGRDRLVLPYRTDAYWTVAV
jgi:SAM-dependent methyltransferase